MDEKWLHEIDRKLAGHEAPPPAGLWEGIADGLNRRAAVRPVRRIPLQGRRWWAAAAVALLLVVGGGVLLTVPGEEQEGISIAPADNGQPVEGALLAQTEPAPASGEAAVRNERPTVSGCPATGEAAVRKEAPSAASPAAGQPREEAATPPHATVAEEPATEGEATPGTRTEQSTPVRKSRPKEIPFRSSSSARRARSGRAGRPTFTLLASNVTGAGSARQADGQVVYGPTFSYSDATPQPMLFKSGYGTFNNQHIAHEGERVFEGKTRHRQPVRVGVTLSWPLTSRLSIETGLSYSHLSSDFSSGYESSYFQTRQRLQYLGLPLHLNYTLHSTPHWQFYVLGGGMAEQCVAGKVTTERVDGEDAVSVHHGSVREKRPQWSAQVAAGVHYGLTRTVGLYAEPGLSYYFDNHSPVVNVYKEHPLNFSFSLGLRLSF